MRDRAAIAAGVRPVRKTAKARRHSIYSYRALAARIQGKAPRSLYALSVRHAQMGQFPRRERGAIFLGSTPELYGYWLQTIVQDTLLTPRLSERILYVNAWNDWAEGNHLEPDRRWGRAYLEATSRALQVETPSHHS